MMKHLLNATKPVAGVLLCAGAAMLAASLTVSRPWHIFVPFAFVAVIVLLAARYGALVSLLGSVAAALVFAYSYAPAGSLRVDNPIERNALAWMLLSSIVISYLLWPPEPHSK